MRAFLSLTLSAKRLSVDDMDNAITSARRAAKLAQLLANAQLAHAAELAIRVRRQWPEQQDAAQKAVAR